MTPSDPESKNADEYNSHHYHTDGNQAFWKVEYGSKDICKLQGWETWGDAIVTAGCLPCVDVDHELGDNTGNIQHAWDQDSKANVNDIRGVFS